MFSLNGYDLHVIAHIYLQNLDVVVAFSARATRIETEACLGVAKATSR